MDDSVAAELVGDPPSCDLLRRGPFRDIAFLMVEGDIEQVIVLVGVAGAARSSGAPLRALDLNGMNIFYVFKPG